MKTLEKIKERVEEAMLAEISKGIENADTKELSEAADILKDLSEAIYYCTITEAMNDSENEYGKDYDENGPMRYYSHSKRVNKPAEMWRDMDVDTMGRMYYTEGGRGGNGSMRYYTEGNNAGNDTRMGRSAKSRMRYFETKEMNDTNAKMQSLEEYTKSLSEDVTEMIAGATENEKQMLRTKLQVLAQKI